MNYFRGGVVVFLYWALAMTVLLVNLADRRGPQLVLRATPRVAVAPARIYLRALIEGELTEAWYCPAVEWTWPDGTHSREESDCPPWSEGRADAQLIWTRAILSGSCQGVSDPGASCHFGVEMTKAGRILGRESIAVLIKGGE